MRNEQSGSDLTVAVGHQYPGPAQNQRSTLSPFNKGKMTTVETAMTLVRGAVCDLQGSDSRISQPHAVIEQESRPLVITDHSTNETCVQSGDEDVVLYHHDELHLYGSGRIRLARPLNEDAHLLRFERRADS